MHFREAVSISRSIGSVRGMKVRKDPEFTEFSRFVHTSNTYGQYSMHCKADSETNFHTLAGRFSGRHSLQKTWALHFGAGPFAARNIRLGHGGNRTKSTFAVCRDVRNAVCYIFKPRREMPEGSIGGSAMQRNRAGRNRTIDTSVEAGQQYLDRCIRVDKPTGISGVLDRTILGDAFEVLPCLPESCADLVIADPPYNLTKSFQGNTFSRRSAEQYEAYTRRWLDAVRPCMKDTASIYVCCDWETSLIIGTVLQDYFTVRSRITWQREKGRGAKSNWKNGLEDIWFATVGDTYTFHLDAVRVRRRVIAPYREAGRPKDWMETEQGNYRDTCPSNFWDDITIPFWSMSENTAHPTQKSEKLTAKIMLASSSEGDVVLDPFLGSGTTSVTARKLNRHFIGIEKEPQYCVWAEQRLEMAEEDARIQGYTDGVFWERNTQKSVKSGRGRQTEQSGGIQRGRTTE